MNQYVVLLNGHPKEILPPGTTQDEANDRAAEVRKVFLEESGTFWAARLIVYATSVEVYQP